MVQSRAEQTGSGVRSTSSGDAAHTPTPWRVHEIYPEEIYATVDDKRFMVADISGAGATAQDTINAAFIVKAVNNHDALVKALQAIAEGTEDEAPPFRCLPRGEMQRIARDVLANI